MALIEPMPTEKLNQLWLAQLSSASSANWLSSSVVVKFCTSGAEIPLMAKVRTPIGVEVGVTLPVLQMIFIPPWSSE